MPTVEFPTGDFMGLVGKKIPLKELEERAAMLGTDVESVDEDRIVVEVFPDRPDMLSVEGFARAYRAFAGLESGLREYVVEVSDITLKTGKSVEDVRPCIAAAIVKNLPISEEALLSIIEMQEALHGSHGRKRSKVAIGVHDFDKTSPPYAYKALKPDAASFVPLDFSEEMTLGEVLEKHPKAEEYRHILEGKKLLPVVMDRGGVVSLPPIINAERTRVTEDSSNLFIEMTGTNKLAVRQALGIVLTSLADRGGRIVSINVDGKRLDLSPASMTLKESYVGKLLGLDLNPKKMKELLGRMGYGAGRSGRGSLEVLIPCYRADVLHPMDVVEDLAIAYGYENFEPERTDITAVGKPNALEERSFDLKMLMVGLGFQETVPFVLTGPEVLERAGIESKPVSIKNPRTQEFTILRPSLIPSLLQTLAYNKKKKIPQRIFELGDAAPSEREWTNKRMLGMAILDREVNFSDMQSAVEALLRNLGVSYKLKEVQRKTFIKGRCGRIFVGRKAAGVFGEVSPEVLENFGLEYPAVLAEMDAEALFE